MSLWLVLSSSAADPPSRERIEQAIRELGADDYEVREKATIFLWTVGVPAEPFLRQALKSADAEVVARARDLLDKIPYGITPASPKKYVALITRARVASPTVWPDIVKEILDESPDGIELAKTIAAQQTAGPRRIAFQRGIDKQAWRIVGRLIAAKQIDKAEEWLARSAAWHAANDGELAILRHYAMLVRVRGTLDKRIAEWTARAAGKTGLEGFLPEGEPDAMAAKRVLAYLYKASGDLVKARTYAETMARPALLEVVRLDASDWAGLADAEPFDKRGQSLMVGGLKMILSRMANVATIDTVAKEFDKLVEAQGRNVYDQWFAFRTLMFDGRTTDALAYAEKSTSAQAMIARAEILAQSGRLADGVKFVSEMSVGKDYVLSREFAKARLLALTGDRKKLDDQLAWLKRDSYADPNEQIAAGEFVETLVAWGRDNDAVDHAAALLAGNAVDVFSKIYPKAPLAAEAWYHFFRDQAPSESKRDSLQKIIPMLDTRLKEPDHFKQFEAAVLWAKRAAPAEQEKWLCGLAEAAVHAGRTDLGLKLLAAAPSPAGTAKLHLGDLYAESGKWSEAATAYDQAAVADANAALPRVLAGFARDKAGDATQGRAWLELGRLLPLASVRSAGNTSDATLLATDETGRLKLCDELAKRVPWIDGLHDEVRRQRRLLIDLSLANSTDARSALSRLCTDVAAFPDKSTAADANQRFVIRMVRTNSYFRGNDGYLNVLHRGLAMKSLARLAANDVPSALKIAHEAHALLPTTTNLAIEIVPALDKLGKKAEADAFYRKVAGVLDGLIKDFPESDHCLNYRAWLAARCRRDLDKAAGWSEKAVELAPTMHGYQETLAEVHLQRGEKDQAVAVLRALVNRQPHNASWVKLLRRAEAGDAAAPLPER